MKRSIKGYRQRRYPITCQKNYGNNDKIKEKDFSGFLSSEYNNIAQAHFNTAETITTFFRYYLILVALPFPVALILSSTNSAKTSLLETLPISPLALVSLICIVIAFAGLCVGWYISELRCDSVLYARTVNGIRKHFFNASDVPPHHELKIRVLPRSTELPRYQDFWFFGGVIISFLIINTTYYSIGYSCYLSWTGIPWNHHLFGDARLWIICTGSLFALLHIFGYKMIAGRHERCYLKSRTIGVDIDGVLNDHRQHFCEILKRETGKKVNPDQITKNPVHECDDLDVSWIEEQQVFHCKDYWTQMPVKKDAKYYMNKLREDLGYKIHIFSHRPWPSEKLKGKRGREWFWPKVLPFPGLRLWPSPFLKPAIWRFTKKWLKKHKFNYDHLLIEEGKIYSSNTQVATRNRYVKTSKKMIPIFIEDTTRNACKLADLCEIVFLIRQPYNKEDGKDLPKNVIMVDGWGDIYHFIRDNF